MNIYRKIVPAVFGKMWFENTLDLAARKLPKTTAKKWRELSICQDGRAHGVNRGGLASFCSLRKVRKPVQY